MSEQWIVKTNLTSRSKIRETESSFYGISYTSDFFDEVSIIVEDSWLTFVDETNTLIGKINLAFADGRTELVRLLVEKSTGKNFNQLKTGDRLDISESNKHNSSLLLSMLLEKPAKVLVNTDKAPSSSIIQMLPSKKACLCSFQSLFVGLLFAENNPPAIQCLLDSKGKHIRQLCNSEKIHWPELNEALYQYYAG